MLESILQAVGRTPLVRLKHLAEGVQATVCVKVESLNPGGSIKDRVAIAMVEEAEREGWLRPGGTIIEATAGNTGVGLALAAAVKGHRCIFVLPDKMSGEKVRLLKAYGAEIVITPTDVPPDSPESYNGVANRLAREIPNAWRPNQFANMANPEVHYRSTGPEIWEQTDGRITAFVAGAGTGGTISGVGRYLKERNRKVRIIGADPEGSVLSGDAPHPWKVEGIGEDFVPQTLNGQMVDEWIRVGDAESFSTARALAQREGILVGGSSGTAVAAALRYARRLAAGDLVVALCADTGRNYLSKFFDDDWLTANHLRWDVPPAHTVADLLLRRGPRSLATVGPDATVADAVDVMQGTGISQLPVLSDGIAVGSIQEVTVARVLHDGRDPGQVAVGDVMARALPQLDVGVHLDEAYRLLLAGNTGVLATSGGAVVDIITRIDLIQYWNQPRPLTTGRVAPAETAETGAALALSATVAPGDHGMSGETSAQGFATRAIHAGQEADPTTGATVVPIYATSTFTQAGPGEHKGYEYSRSGNPTRTALEACLAALEGGERALAFASGLAASTAVLSTLRPGDEVAAAADLYGGTYRLLERVFRPWGIVPRYTDDASTAGIASILTPATRLVWIETPTNPLLQVLDIAPIAAAAHAAGALLAVDNTFASPYLQQPLGLGADLVVHSTTKYLGGHSDVVGGAVIGSKALLEPIAFYQNAAGGVPGPFDSWLVLRGLKTLAVRMDRHCSNARHLATWLAEQPKVERVYYPGLPGHPHHDIAARQMRDFGGMISIRVSGGLEGAKRVLTRTRLFSLAESLGGVESLISHPATMTHASIPAEIRRARGVDDGLVRISVGIEDVRDLQEDLGQALS